MIMACIKRHNNVIFVCLHHIAHAKFMGTGCKALCANTKYFGLNAVHNACDVFCRLKHLVIAVL